MVLIDPFLQDERREIYDQLSPYQAPASKENEIYGQLKSWGTRSIPRSDIQSVCVDKICK